MTFLPSFNLRQILSMFFNLNCSLPYSQHPGNKASRKKCTAAHYKNLVFEQWGVSTPRRAISEKKNSSGNLKILPGIGWIEKFSGKHEVMKLKFRKVKIFSEFLPIPHFWEDFYLHVVLLKEHLLGLSPPVTFFSCSYKKT